MVIPSSSTSSSLRAAASFALASAAWVASLIAAGSFWSEAFWSNSLSIHTVRATPALYRIGLNATWVLCAKIFRDLRTCGFQLAFRLQSQLTTGGVDVVAFLASQCRRDSTFA